MTDYKQSLQRPWHKRFAIWALNIGWLNGPVIALIKALPAARWHERVPTQSPIAELRLPDGTVIKMSDPSRCNVAREIFWNDNNLAETPDQSALQLAIELSQDADLFLDIGSYSGLFALSVAKLHPDIKVAAFEIVPDNVLLLQRNIALNDLVGRVELKFMGAGAEVGEIYVPAEFQAGLLPSSVALDSKSNDGIRVPVFPLDEVIADRDVRAVLKIDVEGFEWSVLQGAQAFLTATKPDMICEFLTRATDIAEISAFLKQLGYRFFRITEAGLVHCDEITPIKTERDWLLSTRSDEDLGKLTLSLA